MSKRKIEVAQDVLEKLSKDIAALISQARESYDSEHSGDDHYNDPPFPKEEWEQKTVDVIDRLLTGGDVSRCVECKEKITSVDKRPKMKGLCEDCWDEKYYICKNCQKVAEMPDYLDPSVETLACNADLCRKCFLKQDE